MGFWLGRFIATIQSATGTPLTGVSVEVRRQGASVNNFQSGTSPFVVTVDDRGSIEVGDVVVIGTGATTYNVTARTATTVTLSGFGGTLDLNDDDRISPTNNLPSLFVDKHGVEPLSNPVSTGANGRVQAFALGGEYDYKISGGTATPELIRDYRIVPIGAVRNVMEAPYYAQGDGVTDDTLAFQRAIDDAGLTVHGTFGGMVYVPKGTYIVQKNRSLPSQVSMVGISRSGSTLQIKGGETFNGTTDALVRLGVGTGLVHGAKLVNICLNLNDVANSIGVYTSEAQEQSGLFGVTITRAVLYGVLAENAANFPANFTINECEIFMSGSGSAATTKGVYLHNTTGVVRILNSTINNIIGSGITMLAGIHAQHVGGNQVSVMNCHFENATNGVKVSANDCVVVGCTGLTGMTNVVLIDAGVGNVSLLGVFTQGATNGVNDQQNAGAIAGDVGFYFAGGTASPKVIGNNPNVLWRVPNSVEWDGTNTFDGASQFNGNVTIGSASLFDINSRIRKVAFENVAIASTISVTKNNVRITGNGPVTLSTINIDGGAPGAAHDGYELFLVRDAAGTGNYTIDEVGNIRVEGGASIILSGTGGQGVLFRWNNSESRWWQVAPKANHP